MATNEHEAYINQFLVKNPLWKRSGMLRELKKYGEGLEDIQHAGFIPDAFYIDGQNRVLHLLEVEMHSKITKVKMEHLAEFWFDIDCYMWSMNLKIFNVFTKASSYISDGKFCDLWWYFHALRKGNTEEANSFQF